MNPVLKTREFWQPYLTLEPKGVSEGDLAAQLDGLSADYPVREETINYEYCGEHRTAVRRLVDFAFACGDRFSLVIEYEPDVNGCDTNLFLVDIRSGMKHELGWWDLARWHPYCLRQEELDELLEFWQRRDLRWRIAELPLLLLCQFVGLANSKELGTLQTRAEAAYNALGVPAMGEGRNNVPLRVPENYRWEQDAELGWVFTSDEYSCYSLRNRPHHDSDEGRFPFTAFREMMADIRRG
jgi:hypothetical protein